MDEPIYRCTQCGALVPYHKQKGQIINGKRTCLCMNCFVKAHELAAFHNQFKELFLGPKCARRGPFDRLGFHVGFPSPLQSIQYILMKYDPKIRNQSYCNWQDWLRSCVTEARYDS